MTVGADPSTTGNRAPSDRTEEDRVDIPIRDDLRLAPTGRSLPAADRRILTAIAAQAAVALDQHRLRETAAEAAPIAEADKVRTALLAAAPPGSIARHPTTCTPDETPGGRLTMVLSLPAAPVPALGPPDALADPPEPAVHPAAEPSPSTPTWPGPT